MKRILTLLIVLLSTTFIFSQDKHFSQFFAMPLNLNPALTGTMPGKYRAVVIYRNQWQTVLDNSFKTFGGAFDIRLPIGMKNIDALGAGVLFYTDKGGASAFSTNQIALSMAYHKSLGFRKKQYLSSGFMMGISQRNSNFDDLTFNDQFDGESGYTLSSDEPLERNNYTYADLSAGVNFSTRPEKRKALHIGAAIFHANFPNVSFTPDFVERLDPLISGHVSGQTPISRKIDLLPRLLVYNQGANLEANAGANFKFLLSDFSGASLHVGALARGVRDIKNGFGLDAAILLVAFEIESIRVGFSYDSNVSSLVRSSSTFGAFELSLSYTGKDENAGVICPTF